MIPKFLLLNRPFTFGSFLSICTYFPTSWKLDGRLLVRLLLGPGIGSLASSNLDPELIASSRSPPVWASLLGYWAGSHCRGITLDDLLRLHHPNSYHSSCHTFANSSLVMGAAHIRRIQPPHVHTHTILPFNHTPSEVTKEKKRN